MGQIMSDYNPVGCIAPYYSLHWPYIWNDIFFFEVPMHSTLVICAGTLFSVQTGRVC